MKLWENVETIDMSKWVASHDRCCRIIVHSQHLSALRIIPNCEFRLKVKKLEFAALIDFWTQNRVFLE